MVRLEFLSSPSSALPSFFPPFSHTPPNSCSFALPSLSFHQFAAGVQALASLSPALKDPGASLLPDLPDVRAVSVHVAAAVVKRAVDEGRARVPELQGMNMEEIEEMIKQQVSFDSVRASRERREEERRRTRFDRVGR